ncbi:hypothetical protein HK102_002550 [Quaeritorhiza haematococci]|nr:hypothetical protein HK102_002550 [Quaeritorhiza haematococci]
MTMKSLFLGASVAAALGLVQGRPSPTINDTPSGEITYENLAYGGSGCPQGSVGLNFNEDRTAFTVLFDQYVASTGPTVPFAQSRRNCQLSMTVNVPQGYSYSIGTIDTRGFYQLDNGVNAEQKSILYFQGDLQQSTATTRWQGPATGDYSVRDTFDLAGTVWSPCGASSVLNLNTQLRLDNSANRQGSGQMTTDSVDSKVKQVFSLQWRRCDADQPKPSPTASAPACTATVTKTATVTQTAVVSTTSTVLTTSTVATTSTATRYTTLTTTKTDTVQTTKTLTATATTTSTITTTTIKYATSTVTVTSTTTTGVCTPTAVPPPPPANPPSNEVTFGNIGYGGSGCPQGSVALNFNEDRTAFTILFDQFVAAAGQNLPLTQSRKNCQLNIAFNIPQGYSYSVTTIDTRGFYQLDQGVNAEQRVTTYFQGEVEQSTAVTRWRGPGSGDYKLRDAFDMASTVWSPCGASVNLNVNSALRVDNAGNRQGAGVLTTDSQDAKVSQVFGIQWRRC